MRGTCPVYHLGGIAKRPCSNKQSTPRDAILFPRTWGGKGTHERS